MLAGQPRGLLLQAAHGPRAAPDLWQGPDRHDRLPLGRGPDPAAPRAVRRGPPGGQRLPRHLRRRELLLRADGPRPGHRAACPQGPAAPGQGARPAAGRHQRPPLHRRRGRQGPRRPAVRAVRLDADGPQPVQVRRRRLLPQEPRGDAPPVARAARGLRQHPAHRRHVRHLVQRGRGAVHAPLPLPRGRGRDQLVRQGGRARPARPLPRGHPGLRPQAGGLRDRGHRRQGLPRLLPRRRRLHQLGQGERHPGGTGPWLRCRLDVRLCHAHHRPRPGAARSDLRALPQPRAPVDARLRRGFRRAPPRRGHQVRHGEVRRGARRPDRHLRHDQGQAGRQGRRTRARPPLRRRREAHQGHAAGRHGQGHPAVGDLRPRAQAVCRGRGLPRDARLRPRGPGGRRHRARPRGAEAPVGRARRRRHHVQRAADRPDPHHAPRGGRADHHAVRLPELRDARPGQDGLPRPAQPDDPRRRHQERRDEPRRDHRPGRPVQGHDRPGDL